MPNQQFLRVLCYLGNIIIRIPGTAFQKYRCPYLIPDHKISILHKIFKWQHRLLEILPWNLFYLADRTTSFQSSNTLTNTRIHVQSKLWPRLLRYRVDFHSDNCFYANFSRDHKAFIMAPKGSACVVAQGTSFGLELSFPHLLCWANRDTQAQLEHLPPLESLFKSFFSPIYAYLVLVDITIITIICLYFCPFCSPWKQSMSILRPSVHRPQTAFQKSKLDQFTLQLECSNGAYLLSPLSAPSMRFKNLCQLHWWKWIDFLHAFFGVFSPISFLILSLSRTFL